MGTPRYEHASTNLKILLLVFSVAIIVVLGYFVWLQENEPPVVPLDSGERSTAILNEPATSACRLALSANDAISYSNEDVENRFTLTLPKSWEGYTVETSNSTDIFHTYSFFLPENIYSEAGFDTSLMGNPVKVIDINIYTPTQWGNYVASQPIYAPGPVLIGGNVKSVFAYAPIHQDYPDNICLSDVIDTIKITQ